uniref:ATP synthase complex subunit 8 n=1 Tax=Indotyphlus maharashtraensis TaxID=1035548 RepID=W5RH09_INDMA|nr:ATP synthase F0 subunit 8 [Indotyphlus maharashtraensis]AGZ19033.1 ATP synthase F0 subunit 8 [Indotyphlus maharashtraensis]
MPQLSPNPWLLTMVTSWFILLTISIYKITKHKPTNSICLSTQQKQLTMWNWPW